MMEDPGWNVIPSHLVMKNYITLYVKKDLKYYDNMIIYSK